MELARRSRCQLRRCHRPCRVCDVHGVDAQKANQVWWFLVILSNISFCTLDTDSLLPLPFFSQKVDTKGWREIADANFEIGPNQQRVEIDDCQTASCGNTRAGWCKHPGHRSLLGRKKCLTLKCRMMRIRTMMPGAQRSISCEFSVCSSHLRSDKQRHCFD